MHDAYLDCSVDPTYCHKREVRMTFNHIDNAAVPLIYSKYCPLRFIPHKEVPIIRSGHYKFILGAQEIYCRAGEI